MNNKTILILGGGLGGIAAAGNLRRACGPEHRVVVIERNSTFSLRMANLWLMTGERERPEDGQRSLAHLATHGIEWVQAEIEGVDPASRTVRTSAGSLTGDYLIISLGAERHPESVPGVADAALNLYEAEGALRIRQALRSFPGGRVVVLVARMPFSCPSAPYEAAFHADAMLRQRGVREKSTIAVYTPENLPMPVTGPVMGEALVSMLEQKGIEFHAGQTVIKVDPAARRAHFELEDAPFDLLIGVPPHQAPRVLREAELTDASGWVPVDQATLQTRYAGVYAIGDATAVRLPVGKFLPKAGVFADEQARVVAANIAAEIAGNPGTTRFNGHGFCFIEVGDGQAAYGSGNFYGVPAPTVSMEPPSASYWREKKEIERTAHALWM